MKVENVKLASGSVQKMDPVEQTAGRLGFRKNRRAGWQSGPTAAEQNK